MPYWPDTSKQANRTVGIGPTFHTSMLRVIRIVLS